MLTRLIKALLILPIAFLIGFEIIFYSLRWIWDGRGFPDGDPFFWDWYLRVVSKVQNK